MAPKKEQLENDDEVQIISVSSPGLDSGSGGREKLPFRRRRTVEEEAAVEKPSSKLRFRISSKKPAEQAEDCHGMEDISDESVVGSSVRGKCVGEKRKNEEVSDSDWWMPGGPCDASVIPSYGGHIARRIWEEGNCIQDFSSCRSQPGKKMVWLRDWRSAMRPEARALVDASGLAHLPYATLRHIDVALINAFVERWQPDTNTFHLPFGEMTIMLHDVFHILRLPVEGQLVSGQIDSSSLNVQISELLGFPYKDRRGVARNEVFARCRDASRESETEALGYLFAVLGCSLFADKSYGRFQPANIIELQDLRRINGYSWGSATLAHLYRELGKASRSWSKDIGGCLTLLQAWIYEYFPIFQPPRIVLQPGEARAMSWSIGPEVKAKVHEVNDRLIDFRKKLDGLSVDQVNWLPYGPDPAFSAPRTVYNGVIQHHRITEPYMPDRVLRQLGYVQPIPFPIILPEKAQRRNKATYGVKFSDMAKSAWFQFPGSSRLVLTEFDRADDPSTVSEDYLEWYKRYSHSYLLRDANVDAPKQTGDAESRLQILADLASDVWWTSEVARVSAPLLSSRLDTIQDGRIRGACQDLVGLVQRWEAMMVVG